jgi:hypothetical protein
MAKLGAALTLLLAPLLAVPSAVAAETWVLRIHQVDPKSSDPAVTIRCSENVRVLCQAEMKLLWYGEPWTVVLIALVRPGNLFLKFRLKDHETGERYLYVSALPYALIRLGDPTLRSSTYSLDVSLSEPPPSAGEGWPYHWPENGNLVPAATLRIDVRPER